MTSSGTVSSTRSAHVAFRRCLSVLTFTFRYPAHSKLVFIHSSRLAFSVSILSRVQVVSHPFFQKKEHLSTYQEEPTSSRSLHLVPTQRVLKPTEPSFQPDNYTYRQEVGLGRGENRGGMEAT
jgi:hypothetical protein